MKWLALIPVALVLAACGGDGSGGASPTTTGQEVTTVATDPPATRDPGVFRRAQADSAANSMTGTWPQRPSSR